jgi:hypothetical protein
VVAPNLSQNRRRLPLQEKPRQTDEPTLRGGIAQAPVYKSLITMTSSYLLLLMRFCIINSAPKNTIFPKRTLETGLFIPWRTVHLSNLSMNVIVCK